MDFSTVGADSLLECMVALFQVAGVVALIVMRLYPGRPWASRARIAFILALMGLGVSGALCGLHDSEFALFAGGTITFLFVGLTIGNTHPEPATPAVS